MATPAAAESIDVARPLRRPAIQSTRARLNSETFSSYGPGQYRLRCQWNRQASVEHRLKPDVSSVDGANTPCCDIDTDDDVPLNAHQFDPDSFPNFFGTSAAYPDLVAVAALMFQLNPAATHIRDRHRP